jgi:excisionase family DNA binding protein
MSAPEKIRPEHLARPAFVYIRQSTLGQVRHHQESRRRQYDLAAHARTLGWSEVTIIDEDLGKSGASAAGRAGFQRLVAEVSLGRVGAVFGLEVSRLARNNRDWYQLLDLCALLHTLIVDAEGVYDPRELNDRLLLGLKGTMSEAELGWIRQRAHAGLLAKAGRGELHFNLAVGYVATRDGRIEKHPDQRVQAALALVFAKFTELGSVRQVLLWFRQEQVALPALTHAAPWGDHVSWRLPVYNTLLKVLTNPLYAGAYAFGRTETRTQVIGGAPQKTRGHRRARGNWLVLLREHHEDYIAWATYERNQAVIAENAQMKGLMARGAVRRGPSLLAGLLRCGHCGGTVPRYGCPGAQINHGTAPCISFGGLRVDEAVEREVVRVLTPGAIEAARATAVQAASATATVRGAVELELREARYEAERARRQYDAVEPEHRLVAATLEQRWNHALERVRALEHRGEALTAEAAAVVLPDPAALLALAQDFPAVWADPRTDMRTKKRLVRLLLTEIIARLPEEGVIEFVLHWAGGKHTVLRVPRNRTGQHRYCTSREVVAVVRDLAQTLPDAQIARILNRLGYRTGAGNTWTQARVTSLRTSHQIPIFEVPQGEPALLTIAQAARALGVSSSTVQRWILAGVLPGTQPVPHAPWAIPRDALSTAAVHAAVAAARGARPLPRSPSIAQLPLIDPDT